MGSSASIQQECVPLYRSEFTPLLTKEPIESASAPVSQRGTTYDTVTVLTIYWEEDEGEGANANAEQVERVFKNSYNYGAVSFPFLKKHKNPKAELLSKLTDMIGNLDKKKQNLLIINYCGHALSGNWGELYWQPNGTLPSQFLNWEEVQRSLPHANCDWLFILNCCHATGMIIKGQDWARRCEIIMARDDVCTGVNQFYTSLLCSEFILGAKHGGISVSKLYLNLSNPAMMEEHSLETIPGHQIHSKVRAYASCPSQMYRRDSQMMYLWHW